MKIVDSELILNPDGSIYHLNLKPEDIADTIITVGDQNRVQSVSKYFDSIDFETQKREFKTHTGYYKGKRLTVISTGIGIDNIDIVLNELDTLVNIDLKTRKIKDKLTSLNIIRIGTSGALQDYIGLDKFVMSKASLGLDGLPYYYKNYKSVIEDSIDFVNDLNWDPNKPKPYIVECSEELAELFEQEIDVTSGVTLTSLGFYGPQGRKLRLGLEHDNFLQKLIKLTYKDYPVTNMEMETSAIYSLSKMMGHKALSLNAILANRQTGEFSKNPYMVIDDLIRFTLDRVVKI